MTTPLFCVTFLTLLYANVWGFFFMIEKLFEASKEYGPFVKINKCGLDQGTTGLLAPLIGLRFIHLICS